MKNWVVYARFPERPAAHCEFRRAVRATKPWTAISKVLRELYAVELKRKRTREIVLSIQEVPHASNQS